jgi:hypothetical protein
MKNFIDHAEEISHGIAGKEANIWQRGASHGLGYAAALFEKGLSYLPRINIPRKPGYRSPAVVEKPRMGTSHISKEMPKPVRFTGRRRVQKALKKTARKAAKGAVKQMSKAIYKRPAGPSRPAHLQRKTMNMGRRGALVKKRIQPPTSYGYQLRSGMGVSFFPVRRPGCMGATFHVKIGTFTSNSSGSISLATTSGSSTVVGAAYPIAPFFSTYYPPTISTLCQLFETYQVRQFKYRYVNSVNTSTPGRIGIVYLRDPAAVNDNLGISGNGAQIPLTQLASRSDLTEFSVYAPLRSQIYTPSDIRKMHMTAGTYLPTNNIGWANNSAGLRDQIQGALVFSSADIPPNLTGIGDLFLDFSIILCGMLNAPTGSSFMKLREEEHKKRELRETFLQSLTTDKIERLSSLLEDKEDEKEDHRRSRSTASVRSTRSDRD